MSLYRITTEKLEPVSRTTFAAESLLERKDLQRLLRRDITPIADDLMVIAEEYGEWEDSNRRIDLLCLSKDATLVVVEIKRTEDGGHMELQSIRYAAMVSAMTLDQVIQAYNRTHNSDLLASRATILEFLQIESEEEAQLTGEVRIVLVSADFSTELTTAVLWLNRKYEMRITCIRLRPYRMNDEILIDATQIIPLPEATDYEVKIREQEKEKKKAAGKRQDIFRRFWSQLVDRSKSSTSLLANRTATDSHWISAGIGRSGFWLSLVLVKEKAIAECFIRIGQDADRSLAAFVALKAQQLSIESTFGGKLDWQDLPGRTGCRICMEIEGGWMSPENDWPSIQDQMIRSLIQLDSALRKPIQDLRI